MQASSATADCQKTYEELKAKGVEFTQPPTERFYGVEALMKDNSGNWFSLTSALPAPRNKPMHPPPEAARVVGAPAGTRCATCGSPPPTSWPGRDGRDRSAASDRT